MSLKGDLHIVENFDDLSPHEEVCISNLPSKETHFKMFVTWLD